MLFIFQPTVGPRRPKRAQIQSDGRPRWKLKAIASSDPTIYIIPSSLSQLVNALKTNTTVASLNISNCRLNGTSCPQIAELLSRNSTLSSLVWISMASWYKSLKMLTLNSNPLTDRGLIYLTKPISHNNTLLTLEMEGCQITQARRVEQLQSTLFKQRIAARLRLQGHRH
jgi:Ran GTPase-activating protein (RanGAP) involved in mRNA processing and transport